MFNHLKMTPLEPWHDTFQCFCISKVNKHPVSGNEGVEQLQFPHPCSRIPAEGPGGKERDKKGERQNSEREREVSTMLKLSVTVSLQHTEHLALSLEAKAEEKCGRVMGELAWQMPLSTTVTSMSPPRCFSPVTILQTKQLSPFSSALYRASVMQHLPLFSFPLPQILYSFFTVSYTLYFLP